jgi:mannose-6-phosphate isomerase-like protein (cupin superfamily)
MTRTNILLGLCALFLGPIGFTIGVMGPYHGNRNAPSDSPQTAEADSPPTKAAVFTQNDAKKYDIAGGTCWLYPHSPTDRLSCALVHQNGRYPEQGKKVNARCTESLFVFEGTLTVTLGNEAKQLKAYDVVYITPGTAYSVEGTGKAFVFIEPKWDSKQNTPAE